MKIDWYKLSASRVLQQLGSDPAYGLSVAESRQRLAKYGSNELVEKAGRSRAEIVREQLSGVLTILLFVAVLISAVLGDWLEARSESVSLFRIGLFTNRSMVWACALTVVLQLVAVCMPASQRIFNTAAMPLRDLGFSVGMAMLVLAIVEVWKAIMRRGTRGR
jgi:magnesium-transporting ATPase (P-type)